MTLNLQLGYQRLLANAYCYCQAQLIRLRRWYRLPCKYTICAASPCAQIKWTRLYTAALLSGFLLLAFCSTVWANGTAQLRAFITQVHAAQGDFVQESLRPATAKPMSPNSMSPAAANPPASGTFVFSRPGKFIWRYQQPYEQILQADGKTLYVYDKDLRQVTERALTKALGANPASILFGSNDLEAGFTLKNTGPQNGLDWLTLTPKQNPTGADNDAQFELIRLGLRDALPAVMELHDVFGNITRLTLLNIRKNPSISRQMFKFTVPPGVDIIQN